ncbi:endonuclease-8 [Amycolatopsis bartoniae]|uniref:DNA-(apurinic or apyrimidinic site) lyase n=1 Tax=Amycolatopsis bartoniae TaxID=941986 RepID=A0A8H9IWQ2_9PSEU|nr:DNA-formamidopyrimidine glycosylase family protein [Amycolatopsis bartoniae]MBB2935453.1 endonuclease-8 [Amycolatopsis bartoniae]TVT04467.1 Fpg/Nei family DNA glycosylase [Amycolatopsis bartoniae]GHF76129.1 endonuclease VIII [Amycolatopsis bartoniae]
MPEGDTVFLAGKQLDRALAGRTLVKTDFRHPALATTDLSGRTVLAVRTVGKHLFTRFSGDLSLHSHLRMDGSWQLYRPGARWRHPAHHVRVVLAAEEIQAVGFRLHDLELLPTGEESRLVGHLGPDLLDPQWTDEHAERAAAALMEQPDRELGLALLDQRVMAGVGNLYKCEIAFLLGVTPWVPVSEVDAGKTVALARKLLLANAWRHEQSTTGDTTRGRQNWVYERSRQGCFRCGGLLRVGTQGHDVQQRPTWYCPRCQRGPAPAR